MMQSNASPAVDAGPSQSLQRDLCGLPPAYFPVWRKRWGTGVGARQRDPRYLTENQHYEEGILDFGIPAGEYRPCSEPSSPKCTCTRCVYPSTPQNSRQPSPPLHMNDTENSGYDNMFSDLYNNSFPPKISGSNSTGSDPGARLQMPHMGYPLFDCPINPVPSTIVPSTVPHLHPAPLLPAAEAPYSYPASLLSPISSVSSHLVLPNAASPITPCPCLAPSSSPDSCSFSAPNSMPSPLSYPVSAGSSLEYSTTYVGADNCAKTQCTTECYRWLGWR